MILCGIELESVSKCSSNGLARPERISWLNQVKFGLQTKGSGVNDKGIKWQESTGEGQPAYCLTSLQIVIRGC